MCIYIIHIYIRHIYIMFCSSGQACVTTSRARYLLTSPGCKPLCSHLHALAQQRNCGTSLAASRFARFGCKSLCGVN